jgi:hypothetical protein
MIDLSSIRVSQHAANGQEKDERSRCIGRSRGGLTTKFHALVDAEGRPIRLKLTEGQAHDGRSADMFEPVEAGHILLADRAYDGDALRPRHDDRTKRMGQHPRDPWLHHHPLCPSYRSREVANCFADAGYALVTW